MTQPQIGESPCQVRSTCCARTTEDERTISPIRARRKTSSQGANCRRNAAGAESSHSFRGKDLLPGGSKTDRRQAANRRGVRRAPHCEDPARGIEKDQLA